MGVVFRPLATAVFALPVACLVACQQPSPSQRAWPTYEKAAKDILNEYNNAMNNVVAIDLASPSSPAVSPDLATPGKKGGTQPLTTDQAVAKIDSDVVPPLDKAASEANGIELKNVPDIAALHDVLVKGLALKADAYKSIVAAYRSKNAQKFDEAIVKLNKGEQLMTRFQLAFNEGEMDGVPPQLGPEQSDQATQQAPDAATPTPGGIPGIPGIN
jgi:hypothetical protein